MKTIDEIRLLLCTRGWKVDPRAKENRIGELPEFIDPVTNDRLAWLDALTRQMDREEE